SAADPSKNITIYATMTQKDCQPSGRIGLRSYSSGGVWRNVQAMRATNADLQSLRSQAMQSDSHNQLNARSNLSPQNSEGDSLLESPSSDGESPAPIAQSIASLRLISGAHPAVVTIRGVVVLVSPVLYVQDATGGAAILQTHAPPLKVGDEI